MPYKKSSFSIARLPRPVRLRFPNLFEAKPIVKNGQAIGAPIFSAGLVVPADHTDVVEVFQNAQAAIVNQSWPGENLPPAFHWAFAPAEMVAPKDANCAGCYLANANAKADRPPQVFMRNPAFDPAKPQDPITNPPRIPIPVDQRHLVYSGVEAWVSIGLYSYAMSATNLGIGCGLNQVLITGRDLGRFDGRVTEQEAFGDLPDDAYVAVTAPPPVTSVAQPVAGQAQQPYQQPDPMPQAQPAQQPAVQQPGMQQPAVQQPVQQPAVQQPQAGQPQPGFYPEDDPF